MFNFKRLSNNDEIDINNIEKEFMIDNISFDYILNNRYTNKLFFFFNVFDIFNKNPEYYIKEIQDDLIDAYNENNNNRKLILQFILEFLMIMIIFVKMLIHIFHLI